MKKVLLFMLVLCAAAGMAQAQASDAGNMGKADAADTLRPYQKYPTLPAFNIMKMDSSTIFNTYNIPKGHITAIIFFDPECKHCKHTFKGLLAAWDSVEHIKFYLITPTHSMTSLRNFYADNKLADRKNIELVGRDYEFFFFNNYGTKSVPDVVVYDKNKKLVKLIEGEFTATDLYRLTK